MVILGQMVTPEAGTVGAGLGRSEVADGNRRKDICLISALRIMHVSLFGNYPRDRVSHEFVREHAGVSGRL